MSSGAFNSSQAMYYFACMILLNRHNNLLRKAGLKESLNNTTIKWQEHQDSNPDLTPGPALFSYSASKASRLSATAGGRRHKISRFLPIPEAPASNPRKHQYRKQTILQLSLKRGPFSWSQRRHSRVSSDQGLRLSSPGKHAHY